MCATSFAQERLAFIREIDGISTAITRFRPALDEFTALEDIEETDKIGFLDAQSLTEVPLAHAGICSNQHERAELRRAKAKRAHGRMKALSGDKARHPEPESDAGGKEARIELNRSGVSNAARDLLCGFFLSHSLLSILEKRLSMRMNLVRLAAWEHTASGLPGLAARPLCIGIHRCFL